MSHPEDQPRSALNLRLALAAVGLVAFAALAVALFWVGFPVAAWNLTHLGYWFGRTVGG